MSGLTNEDYLAAQFEVVRPLASKFYERDPSLATRMLKSTQVNASSRDVRLPIPLYPGGQFRFLNFQNGDFGLGTGEVLDVAKLSPVEFGIAYEISDRVIYTTDSPQKAAANAVNRSVAMAMDELKNHIDANLQGGGTGILCYVDAGYTSGDTVQATTPFYVDNLRPRTWYSVFNAAQSTFRGKVYVTTLDRPNGTFTVLTGSAATVGITAGDVLTAENLESTPPDGFHGVRYHHNNAASGYWQQMDRSAITELKTPTVDADDNIFSTTHVQAVVAKIEMALGQDAMQGGDWAWYGHPGNLLQYLEQHATISEITMGGGAQGGTDIVQQRGAVMKIHGMPFIQSIHASRTDVDLFNFSQWLRCVYKEIGIHPMGSQQKWGRVGASGGYGGGYIFYITGAMQFGMENPRLAGHIENLLERTDLND